MRTQAFGGPSQPRDAFLSPAQQWAGKPDSPGAGSALPPLAYKHRPEEERPPGAFLRPRVQRAGQADVITEER